MAPWTRISLATLASGYDAVVQLACSLLTQTIQQSANIPAIKRTHEDVSPPDWLPIELRTLLPFYPRKYLTLDSQGDNQVKIVQTNVSFLSKSLGGENSRSQNPYNSPPEYSENNVYVDLEIYNASDSPATFIVQPTVGSLNHSPSLAVTIQPNSYGHTNLVLTNIPEGTHPIKFQLIDLLEGKDQELASGELEAIKVNPLDSKIPENFILDEDTIIQFASKELLRPPQPGETIVSEPPPPGVVTFTYKTDISVPQVLFSADCDASTSTKVALVGGLNIHIKVEEVRSTSTGVKSGKYYFNPYTHELIPEYIVLKSTRVLEERDIVGNLKVDAQLNTIINPTTQVVDVMVDLGQSTITFDTLDSIGQSVFQGEVKSKISQDLSSKGSVRLIPSISLLGGIAAGTNVQEISIQQVKIQFLPSGGSNTRSCLALGLILSGNPTTVGNLQNFVGSDNFATVISGKIMKGLAAFRWRIGDYPKESLGKPIEDAYKDENGNTVQILLYPRIVQKDIIDYQGNTVAGILPFGQVGFPPTTEDFLSLGGHGDIVIVNVLRKDNMQPAPDDVKSRYMSKPQVANAVLFWQFYLSSVAPPQPSSDPNAQAWLEAMRKGVTSHLSRPFAYTHTIILTQRQPNGLENLLLSRGTLSL